MIQFVKQILLQKVAYNLIMLLQRRKYIIPVDTIDRENIVKKNVLVNIIGFSADIICILLIIIGMHQQIVTYIGMITISMYIFLDHFKIYYSQVEKIRKNSYIGYIRNKKALFKWYTPNLKVIIYIVIIFIVLLFMTISQMIGLYTIKSNFWYYIIISIILCYMSFIKIKHYFLDTFDIQEYVLKKER